MGYSQIRVDNTPFREAFKASGLSAYEVARRLGWDRRYPDGLVRSDESKVRRVLGLRGPYNQKTLTYEMALDLAKVLNLDPMDAGL